MIALKHSLRLWSEGGFSPHTVVPPKALAPRIRPQDIGKQPGALVDGSELEWAALAWAKMTPDRLPWLERSMAAGANVGVRTGENFTFVDCDVMSEAESSSFLALTGSILGRGPLRVGRHPRWAMMFRGKFATRAWELHRDGEKVGGIDLLGVGRQIVVQGIHPVTMQPYIWSEDPLGIDTPPPEVDEITDEKLAEWAVSIPSWAASHGMTLRASQGRAPGSEDDPPPDQSSLAWPGSVGEFLSIVGGVPNPMETTRDEWVKIGHAIKASLPGNEDAAYAAWLQWSLKWEPGPGQAPNTAEHCRLKWLGINPPFRVGWQIVAGRNAYIAARVIFAKEPAVMPDALALAALLDDTPPAATIPLRRPALTEDETAHLDEPQQAFARVVLALGFGQSAPKDGHLIRSAVDYLARRLRGRAMRALESDTLIFFEGSDWHRLPVARAAPVLRLWGARYADHFFDGEGTRLEKLRDMLKTHIPGELGREALRSCTPLEGVDDFDADMGLLNTPAGVVDLKSGTLRPRSRDDRVSFRTAVTPEKGAAPMFDELIASVTQGMGNYGREHVQLMCGSILLGNPQHRFWIVQGPGGNGKSTLADVIRLVLNGAGFEGYAKKGVRELLTKEETPKYSLAPLKGARFVFFGEAPTGRTRLRADSIKTFASSDQVTDRFPFAPQWLTFSLRCVPMLVANAPPMIDMEGGDTGVQRRLEITAAPPDQPARSTYRDGDANAEFAQLVVKREGAAVLAWMVEGAMKVQQGGFVRTGGAVATRRMLMLEAALLTDPVGAWLAYFLRPTKADEELPENRLPVSSLGPLMVAWAEQHRPDDAASLAARMGDPARIGRALRQLGFTKARATATRRAEIYAMQTDWARCDEAADDRVRQGWAMSADTWAEARDLTKPPNNVTRIFQ